MRWWERSFGLDIRSIALLRVGLGLYTCADSMQRLLEARFYFSDFGVLPRADLAASVNRWFWSVHLINDTVFWQVALFSLAILANLAMAAGYRTGVASVLSWVLVVSAQNRNEWVLDGGDVVHRMLMFWALFLPLGAVWSVDSARRPWTGGASTTITSVGAVAFKAQMALIFICAAVLKSGDPWRKNFNAAWYALQYDVYSTSFGIWLRQYPVFLQWLTRGTLFIEGLVPFGLFVPVGPIQVTAILLLLSVHVGFVFCMHLIMFSGIMMIGWAALTPGWFWDRLGVPADTPPEWAARLIAWTERWPLRAMQSEPWFDRRPRFGHGFPAVCLLYILAWNLRSLDPARFTRFFPTKLNAFGQLVRLDQHWNMFAPNPVSEDGWLVIPGKLAGGGMVDLFREGAPVSWDRPESIAATYKNRRGRKYYWAVTSGDAPEVRKQFARYLCRAWPEQSTETLESFQIFLMHEVSRPDLTVSVPEKMLLHEHKCP